MFNRSGSKRHAVPEKAANYEEVQNPGQPRGGLEEGRSGHPRAKRDFRGIPASGGLGRVPTRCPSSGGIEIEVSCTSRMENHWVLKPEQPASFVA